MEGPGGLAFRFSEGVAQFGSNALTRLSEDLVLDGNLFDLPATGVTVGDLARLAGKDPAEGLGIQLFGLFDLRWTGGVLTPEGISGAVFEVAIADVLPDAAGLCLSPPEISERVACLRELRRAYLEFARAAAASAPVDDSIVPLSPPGPVDILGALAGAWSTSVRAGLEGALPLAESRAFFASLGDDAEMAEDAPSLLGYLHALEEARAALFLSGSDGQVDLTVLEAEEAGANKARLALFQRLEEPDAIRNLDAFGTTLRQVLDIIAFRQLVGLENGVDAELMEALERAWARFLKDYVSNLGVLPGEFTAYHPDGTPGNRRILITRPLPKPPPSSSTTAKALSTSARRPPLPPKRISPSAAIPS